MSLKEDASSACVNVCVTLTTNSENSPDSDSDSVRDERCMQTDPQQIKQERRNDPSDSPNHTFETQNICLTESTETILKTSSVFNCKNGNDEPSLDLKSPKAVDGNSSTNVARFYDADVSEEKPENGMTMMTGDGMHNVHGSRSETDLLVRPGDVRAPSELTETTDGEETESETTSADFDQDYDYEPPNKSQKLTQVIIGENELQSTLQGLCHSGDAAQQPYIFILKHKSEASENAHNISIDHLTDSPQKSNGDKDDCETAPFSNVIFSNSPNSVRLVTPVIDSRVNLAPDSTNSTPFLQLEPDYVDPTVRGNLFKRHRDLAGVLKRVFVDKEKDESPALSLTSASSDITLPSLGGDATSNIPRTSTSCLFVQESDLATSTNSDLQNNRTPTATSVGLSIPSHLLHNDFQWLPPPPSSSANTTRHGSDISIPSASQVQSSLLQAVCATPESGVSSQLFTPQEEQLTPLQPLQKTISHPCTVNSGSRLVYTPHPRTGQLLYVSQSDESPSFTQKIIWPGGQGSTHCHFATPQNQINKETSTTLNLNSSGEENPSPPEFLQPTPYNTPENGVFKCQHSLENLPFFSQGEDPSREQHNLKERRRRARVKDACNFMRKLVPGMSDKTDKATVFEFAARYIHFLKGYTGNQHDKDFLLKYSPY